MSDLLCTDLILYDNWPGEAKELLASPEDGFDGPSHTGVALPKYQLGTKVAVYDTTSEGWSMFIYLKNVDAGSIGTTAIGMMCGPDGTYLHRVDQDPNSATAMGVVGSGLIGICVRAMPANTYGWFWCGGVVVQDAKWGCTGLSSTSVVTASSGVADGDAAVMLTDGNAGLYLDTWTGDLIPVGIALAADA